MSAPLPEIRVAEVVLASSGTFSPREGQLEALEARLLCETWTKTDMRLLLASLETLAAERDRLVAELADLRAAVSVGQNE